MLKTYRHWVGCREVGYSGGILRWDVDVALQEVGYGDLVLVPGRPQQLGRFGLWWDNGRLEYYKMFSQGFFY